jgi:hypothetical protein
LHLISCFQVPHKNWENIPSGRIVALNFLFAFRSGKISTWSLSNHTEYNHTQFLVHYLA